MLRVRRPPENHSFFASHAVTAVVILALLTACGGRQPELTAPDLSILNLTFGDDSAEAVFRLDNTAAVPLDIARLTFTLAFEGDRFDLEPDFAVSVPALGSENFTVQLNDASAPDGRFGYTVEGVVTTTADRELRFDREGRLYPTPGRPGSFR